MRETRDAQASIFDFYAQHELGRQLSDLSVELDRHPDFLDTVAFDIGSSIRSNGGAPGLSIESILRALLLKNLLRLSYRRLAFQLSDSPTCRSFARLRSSESPSHSTLQGLIRRIRPETLKWINERLLSKWHEAGLISMECLRIDSTVVESHIASPSDSSLLEDGTRVLSRLMSKCKDVTGVKLRFVDQRRRSKSLAFQIFHAKKAEKQGLYPQLLSCTSITLKQVERALQRVETEAGTTDPSVSRWVHEVRHYRELLCQVVDQTQRRIFNDEVVPATEKLVSLFEPHTDVIVKGQRDIQFGHKVNLATQEDGFITYVNVESGNPSDKDLFMPVLEHIDTCYAVTPRSVVADGGYASRDNVSAGREQGAAHVVFHKPVGMGLHAMGVKRKTFDALRRFRAGIEGNISELKRSFGVDRADWKGREGFDAFVLSSVLTFNLVRFVRIDSG